jgi:hypothetical protein
MKGEISAGRFALGGRYGNNILDKSRRCTDEYWDVFMNFNGVPQDVDYVIGTESSRGRIQFFDANLYYTVWGPVKTGEASRKLWPADRLSLDVFGGYQWYHGRYVMVDPVWGRKALANGSWWTQTVPELPAEEGLYYPYAVTYRGPRAGVRANGTAGRFSSSLSLAFAYLETEASGYWANYSFRQKGSGGYGIDAGLEATYAITPSWSFGLGYNFIGLYQKRMKETDTFPDPFNPGSFIDVEAGNVVRDTENTTYGFVFILKYIW